MSTTVNVEKPDFDNTEILNDDAIEQIGQEVNELIELLDDDEDSDGQSIAIHYPSLMSKSAKRDHEDGNYYTKNNGFYYT